VDEVAAAIFPGDEEQCGQVAVAAEEAVFLSEFLEIDLVEEPGDAISASDGDESVEPGLVEEVVENFCAGVVISGESAWPGWRELIWNDFPSSELLEIFHADSGSFGVGGVGECEDANLLSFRGNVSHFR
jgi:hypothetical protein